ncbi:MAG: TonB-dependent receptor [Pelagimonas sp.]|jgi:hemoglobin/transferrin/lactoferrin receptor protein|nr:TonB-dependent receptor [Pelagimonas sp.]
MPKAHLRASTALVVALTSAVPASAQDGGFLGYIYSTDGKRDLAIGTATPTTVVEDEEIKDRQAGTVGELIDSIPSVDVVNGRTPHGASVLIRGYGAVPGTYGTDNKILILDDGATVGSEELYRISTQLFTDPLLYRSVEVKRGTIGSFEYGSGVVGGVILTESKNASDFTDGEPGFRFAETIEASSNGDGFTSSSTLAWQPSENLELLANYTSRKLGNYDNADGKEIKQTGGFTPTWLIKGKYTFGQDDSQSLTFSHKKTVSNENNISYNSQDPTSSFGRVNRDTESKISALKYTYQPGSDLVDLNVELTYSDQVINNEPAPGNTSTSGLYTAQHRYETLKLTTKNTSRFDTGIISHNATYGVELQKRTRATASNAPGGTDNRLAVFVINEMDFGNGLTLTPALRWEKSRVKADYRSYTPAQQAQLRALGEEFESEAFMGGLSAEYEWTNGFRVFGSAAYTEAMPIIDDLPEISTRSGAATYGGEMATTEKSRTFEFGAAYAGTDVFTAGDNFSIKGNVYQTNTWDFTSLRNVERAETSGFELEASYGLENGLYFDLAGEISQGREYYSNPQTASDLTSTNDTLPWRFLSGDSLRLTLGKKWEEKLDLSWEVVHTAAFTQNYSGFTVTNIPNPGSGTSWRDKRKVPSSTLHNLRATFRPKSGVFEGTEMRFGIENAFNESHTPALSTFDAPGRNVKFSLTKVF